jgi:copper(I)-binding protein
MRRFILPLVAACALTAVSIFTTFAQHAVTKAGDITVSDGWLRAMLPGQPAGGGYVTITNGGSAADRLVSVSTTIAGKSELHMMEMKGDVMIMRPVEGGIEIPAGGAVELKPGGLHLMFMHVTEPFKEGATVQVTLEFEKAGKVEVSMPVKTASGH